MASYDYDLVIVGGGLGGAALARAMAQSGRRVLVLPPSREPCGSGAAARMPDGTSIQRVRAGSTAGTRGDLPGAQVEVILRDHALVLRPHVPVPLERVRDAGGQLRPVALSRR